MMKNLLAVLAMSALGTRALAVEVPLAVREAAGVARAGNPVNSGVPLPRGAVQTPDQLRLLDERGQVVLASIEPRARWVQDKSLKWVTVHFLADLPAAGVANYRLVTSQAPLPPSPLQVMQEQAAITVVTGPAKFVIPTDRLAPFTQVFLRADAGREFAEGDAILAGSATTVLAGRNGQSRVVPRPGREGLFRSEVVEIAPAFMQTAVVESAEIEERGPGRAVVALKGAFSTAAVESLDFTARLYFYAGSPLAQMTFSVRNRQLDDWARFVGIERLAVELPMRTKGAPAAAVAMDGQVHRTAAGAGQGLTLFQSAWNQAVVTLPDGRQSDGGQSPGWVRLDAGEGVLTAGVRWFWETYPKGMTARPDGTVTLELKPAQGTRVDLYTGGAKTHFLFFHFGRPDAPAPEQIAAGTTDPLFAACSPDWYCQETRVFGDLYAARADLFDPQHRDVVTRFQAVVDARIRTVVSNRPRERWTLGVDEYGWLDFGSGLHHRTRVFETAEESWWDSNYYDFPHAVLINYLRTGDLLNLRTAEEAGLHLADIDICHSFPGRPEWAGAPRSGPVVGHFRNYAGKQEYMGHASFTFYKNESLYGLYYLTGERWYQEIGRMSSDFAMARWGQGALRNLAHGIMGVLSAYHDTHDEKYLERARFFVDEWGKPWQDRHNGSFQDAHWMYGLVFEAYHKYYQVTGDRETARYLVRALDALIAEVWSEEKGVGGLPGILVYGFGLGYKHTGNKEYLRKGLRVLDLLAQPGAEGDRVKTFAQNFRSSPYFLTFLTTGYRPPAVLKAPQGSGN